MSDKTELDLDAERASFEKLMRSDGWGEEHFELVLGFEGPGYRSNHMEGAWSCWLAVAARRATIQPTGAEPVAWGKCVWCEAPSTTRDRACSAPDGDGHMFKRVTDPVAPADAVREARNEDTVRLDFMAERGAWVAWNREGESCRVFHHNGEDGSEPIMGWVPEAWADTAREAIDAAMKLSTPKEPAK